MPRRVGDAGVALVLSPAGANAGVCAPFPFAGEEVALPVAARVIPDRRYEDDDDLRVTLDETPWTTLTPTLRRAA